MIASTLKYVASEINQYYDNPAAPAVEEFVVLGNISRLDISSGAGNADMQKKVVVSLINIEEEKTLKNNPFYVKQGESVMKRNPTLFLNLYVLFSCADDDYENALIKIGRVFGFFQQQYVFTPNSNPQFPEGVEKLVFDLFSPNFEQLNHLWGILGGKYIPSVLYKMRLVAVQESLPKEAYPIREVKSTENSN